jgi:hypothetical protein
VVADKEIFLVGCQVLLTSYTIGDVEVVESLVEELHPFVMLHRHDDIIDVILVDTSLEEIDDEAGQFLAQLRSQYLI